MKTLKMLGSRGIIERIKPSNFPKCRIWGTGDGRRYIYPGLFKCFDSTSRDLELDI